MEDLNNPIPTSFNSDLKKVSVNECYVAEGMVIKTKKK